MGHYWSVYVDSFARLCDRRCHCHTTPCGYEHEPCGHYSNYKRDGNTTQPVYVCYCPRVLDDAGRLLLLGIAHHGTWDVAQTYAGYASLGELIGRSELQTRRIANELVLKGILLARTCEQMQCAGNHRLKHLVINSHLPGMTSFLTQYPHQSPDYKPSQQKKGKRVTF